MGECGDDGDAEVHFHEVGHECRQDGQDEQLVAAAVDRGHGRVVALGMHGQQVDGHVDDQARDEPCGQADPRQAQAAVEDQRQDDPRKPASGKRDDEGVAGPPAANEAQPAQGVVEDAGEQEDLRGELKQAPARQRVERLVVRPVGRRVARLKPAKLGRVEAVERDPQRLGPVTHQRADHGEGIGPAVRRTQGLGRRHHVEHALPDQHADGVRSLAEAEERTGSADVAHVAQTLQRAIGHVEDDQQGDAGQAQADQRDPGRAHACPQAAHEGRGAGGIAAGACQQQQPKHQEHVQARGQTELGTPALSEDDRCDLHAQDEQVGAGREHCGDAAALL